MKKTRLLAFLLTACLATTCFLSGTVAKYSTTGAVTDAARVAKWGVTIAADEDNDTLFDSSYNNANSVVTVQTTELNTKVVAPGTGDSVTMELSGQPEVAVKVTLDVSGNDIKLPAKNGYKDYTSTNSAGTFDLAADYYPVVFTLTKYDNGTPTVIKTGTLAQINAYLADTDENSENGNTPWVDEYAVNKDLGQVSYTLSWTWVFETNNDAADTYLGNVIAGTATDSTAVTETGNVTLTVIVEQVD